MIVLEIQLDSCTLRWYGYKSLHFDRYTDSHSSLHAGQVDRLRIGSFNKVNVCVNSNMNKYKINTQWQGQPKQMFD